MMDFQKSARLCFCLVTASATWGSVAQAQPTGFACPKAGTIEQRGSFKITYTGQSSGDAYTCARLDPWSKPEIRLFNLYTLSETNNTAAANAGARAGMMDLLSGKKASVNFPYTSFDGYSSQETWKFLGKEPVSLDGKTFDAMTFSLERVADPRGRSAFHGNYKQWLDPKTGLWVKSELTVVGGEIGKYPRSYTDTSITLP
jgi:hypothetical protein